MSDAFVSPAVGGTMWVASAAAVVYCSAKLKQEQRTDLPPLMGVLGAFVFAAQMINFAIPGTGSSGHIGGGLLLAALLGPYAAFLTIASVLIIQALFFADGGILALGCNIFNLGFFPCFIAFPLIYKTITGQDSNVPSKGRIFWGALLASIAGLQLGAFAVVAETRLSGVSELPFLAFIAAMQPIHLAIGIVEGLATAALILFLRQMQPSLLLPHHKQKTSLKPALASLAIMAVLTAGLFSNLASDRPDGLEWAVEKTAAVEELEAPDTSLYSSLDSFVEKVAFFPDYDFRENDSDETAGGPAGTLVAGLSGTAITLVLCMAIGLSRRRKTVIQS